MRRAYFMNSTTAPLDARVRDFMLPLLEEDPRLPSGLLADRRRTATVIGQARERVARCVGARPEEIVFTSGGTEACNLALKGVALSRLARGGRPGRILVATTEHSCVLYPARTLSKLGFDVREVPVDRYGSIDLEALSDMMGADTLLVSVAAATAETGVLQPIEEVVRLSHERGALVHTDVCLAAACQPLDVRRLDVDLASLSAHKMRGPRGAGALFAREGVRLTPLVEGGVNEGGRRGGAEPVAALAGFGEAARLAVEELPGDGPRVGAMGERLQESLCRIPGVTLNGHPENRLRSMVNLSVAGLDGEALVMKLDRRGFSASSGSSCFEATGKPSHVLLAMGSPPELARGSVLFSVGRDNTMTEIQRLAEVFPDVVESLRAIAVEDAP